MSLENVTQEGLILRAGSTVKVPPLPERITIPEGSTTTWDAETMTLTVTTPSEVEGEEPTVTEYEITEQEVSDALAWTPDPDPVTEWTPLEFFERLTDPEKAAIVNSTDTTVRIVYGQFLAATEIDASDVRTQQGMAALVAAGILTQQRSDEILIGE